MIWPLGRPRRRWEDNIKVYFTETVCLVVWARLVGLTGEFNVGSCGRCLQLQFQFQSKNQGHEGFRASLMLRGSARRFPLMCNCHWPRSGGMERPPYNKRTLCFLSGRVLCLKMRQVNVL